MIFRHHHSSKFCWNENTTPRETVLLWIVRVSLFYFNSFSAFQQCFQLPFLFFGSQLGKKDCDPAQFFV